MLPEKTFKIKTLQKHFQYSQTAIENIMKNHKESYQLTKEELKTSYANLIDYIQSYYFEIDKGNYMFYDVITEEFIFKRSEDFEKEVLNKIDDIKQVKKLIAQNNRIYRITSKIDKPRIYTEGNEYYINECKGFMHKSYKPYDEYDDVIKEKVQIMLNMIKEISCNNDGELYDAYIKYLSQLCHGLKTDIIIYKKSEQGTGKSTESEFIMNHVLGKDLCIQSSTEPLLTDRNKCYMGKLFIIFEELPTFGKSQWEGVSSKLKTFTTERTTMFRGLFKDPIQADNHMNFMINTNVEALKDSDGRRIIILPIKSTKKGNFKYFENIKKNCYNNIVGEAFFSYMRTKVDIEGFYGQRDFPQTENKEVAIANLLHPVYKFIKYSFVLKNEGINKCKPLELYNHYLQYCKQEDLKYLGKNDFIRKLEDININFKKSNGNNYYNLSYEELKEIADKNKWICRYDEVMVSESNTFHDSDDEDENEIVNYKQKYIKQKQQINDLNKQLKHLRDLLKSNNIQL